MNFIPWSKNQDAEIYQFVHNLIWSCNSAILIRIFIRKNIFINEVQLIDSSLNCFHSYLWTTAIFTHFFYIVCISLHRDNRTFFLLMNIYLSVTSFKWSSSWMFCDGSGHLKINKKFKMFSHSWNFMKKKS